VTDCVSKVDRRVRRSTAALQHALVELTLEKGYSATTIDDITNRADVARATFYAHYTDKQALLTSIATDLTDDMTIRFGPRAPMSSTTRGEVALEMFRHAETNRDIYRVLLGGAGDPPVLHAYVDALAKAAEVIFAARAKSLKVTPRLPVEFLARMWVGQHVALLSWWLLGDLPYTAEQVALMRTKYHVNGAEWAHGAAPGQWVFDASLYGPDAEVPVS